MDGPEIDCPMHGRADYVGQAVAEALAPTVARLIEDAVGERLAGVRWRVEVACDGYANLMDDDVPHDMDEASYQEGAREAAEQIRAALSPANASQTPSEAPRSHDGASPRVSRPSETGTPARSEKP
jgi:hypothetical protein